MNFSNWLPFILIVRFCVSSQVAENVTSGYVFDENASILNSSNGDVQLSIANYSGSPATAVTSTPPTIIKTKIPSKLKLEFFCMFAADISIKSLLNVFGGMIYETCHLVCDLNIGAIVSGYLGLQFFFIFLRLFMAYGYKRFSKLACLAILIQPLITSAPLISYFVDPVAPNFFFATRLMIGLGIAIGVLDLLHLTAYN